VQERSHFQRRKLNPILPEPLRNLRACLSCTLIKTAAQFEDDGCDNCPFLDLKGSHNNVLDCTTAIFDGSIGVIDPAKSWVAKWQHLQNVRPGVYAIQVTGQLPEETLDELSRRGIRIEAHDRS